MTRLRRELGDATALASVGPAAAAWDGCAARTWNWHRSALRSFTGWAAGPGRGWVTADLAALVERRPETRDRTRAIARREVEQLLERRGVPLRECSVAGPGAAGGFAVLGIPGQVDRAKVLAHWRLYARAEGPGE